MSTGRKGVNTRASLQSESENSENGQTNTETILQTLISRIDGLANKMNENHQDVKKDISDLKDSITSIDKTILETKTTADENKNKITKLQSQLESANATINSLHMKVDTLQNQHSSLDTYIRRDNIRFLNIPEGKDENCEDLVRYILISKLDFSQEEVSAMKIVRCHRLGAFDPNRKRPIICRFFFWPDRQAVWKRGNKLNGQDIRMEEDFSPEVIVRCRSLLPIMYEARRQGKYSVLVADKLIIDRKTFTLETIDQISDELNPMKLCTKEVADGIIAFYGSLTPLSNFYSVSFVDDESMKFGSTEQYYQYKKACFFDDDISSTKILASTSPKDCKFHGDRVKNYDDSVWRMHARRIMKTGLVYKFVRNEKCRKALLDTGDATLAEASSSDKLWGIGMSLKDNNIRDQSLWAENWMGKLLVEVRDHVAKL